MPGARTLYLTITLAALLFGGKALAPGLYRAASLNPRLAAAVGSGDLAGAERLIAEGARVDTRANLGTCPAPDQPDCALGLAAYQGDPLTVRRFLSGGATVDLRSRTGGTPLMLAAAMNQAEVVRVLLQAGANVNARDESGETALMYNTNDLSVVKRLIRAGARVDAQDRQGGSPLMYAAEQPDGVLIHYLLRHAAGVKPALELRDREGQTALFRARIFEYSFRELLDAGANPSNTNDHGWSLFPMVSPQQQKLLLKAGAKPP